MCVCVCAKDTHKNLTGRAIECFHFFVCVCPVVRRNCAGSHDYNAIVVFFSSTKRHFTSFFIIIKGRAFFSFRHRRKWHHRPAKTGQLWEIENPWFDEVPLQKEEDFMYLFKKKRSKKKKRKSSVSKFSSSRKRKFRIERERLMRISAK